MTIAGTDASGARRRAAALCVVAGLVILPLLLTAWTIAAATSRVAANRDLSRMLGELETRLDASGVGDDGEGAERSFFTGETLGVAGAALQAEIAAIVESADAETVEMELLDLEEGVDPGALRLRITFEARNDALQRILLAVEGHMKALTVRSLAIDVSGDAASEDGVPGSGLRATALIEGYWQGTRR